MKKTEPVTDTHIDPDKLENSIAWDIQNACGVLLMVKAAIDGIARPEDAGCNDSGALQSAGRALTNQACILDDLPSRISVLRRLILKATPETRVPLSQERTGSTVDILIGGAPQPGEFKAIFADGKNRRSVGYLDGNLVSVENGSTRSVTLKESAMILFRLWIAAADRDDLGTFDDWARCQWVEAISREL